MRIFVLRRMANTWRLSLTLKVIVKLQWNLCKKSIRDILTLGRQHCRSIYRGRSGNSSKKFSKKKTWTNWLPLLRKQWVCLKWRWSKYQFGLHPLRILIWFWSSFLRICDCFCFGTAIVEWFVLSLSSHQSVSESCQQFITAPNNRESDGECIFRDSDGAKNVHQQFGPKIKRFGVDAFPLRFTRTKSVRPNFAQWSSVNVFLYFVQNHVILQ